MGKTIKSGAREVIFNVFKRCLAEYHAGKLLTELDDLYKRVADMTGKSESTVRRIINEGNKNEGKFTTPAKHRKSIEKAFNSIGPETWNNSVEHIKKIEHDYYERGRTLYEDIDRLVIRVGEDSSDSSSDSEDDQELGSDMSGVENLDSD